MTEHARTLDILVIGAGQAGLALGFHLKKTPFRFQLVERNARVGDSWRERYASLVLFTPRAYSALPGLAMPGDPDVFPTKDKIGDYLETYANHFDLPVVLGTGIRRIERVDGSFRVITEAGEPIDSRAVVLATGAFQRPAIPSISRGLSAEVTQLAPEDYKAPSQLSPGTVLVVGDGATGRQIALELAAAHEVLLAAGRPRRVSPDRILGKSVFWLVAKLKNEPAAKSIQTVIEYDPQPPFGGIEQNGGVSADRLATMLAEHRAELERALAGRPDLYHKLFG